MFCTLFRVLVLATVAGGMAGCATSQGAVGEPPEAPFATAFAPAQTALPSQPNRPLQNGGAEVAPPAGFISFCLRFKDQCAVPPHAPAEVVLTPAVWSELQRVDRDVNAAIWPEDDQKHYDRADFWTIPTDGYGDCEDSALTKRKNLIDMGFSEAALRIAIVITPRAERHAVLTVTTDKGDFVLDNLRDDVLSWDDTGYLWIERQDPSRQFGWVSLQTPERMLATNLSAPTGAVK